MKNWIQTQLRHLVTGLATFLVDTGLLEQTESDNFVRTAVVVLTIVITRSALLLFAKLDLKSVALWVSSKFSLVCVGILSMAAVGGLLPSCSSPLVQGSSLEVSGPIPGLPGVSGGVKCDANGCDFGVEATK
jgi:hypothetical protein